MRLRNKILYGMIKAALRLAMFIALKYSGPYTGNTAGVARAILHDAEGDTGYWAVRKGMVNGSMELAELDDLNWN